MLDLGRHIPIGIFPNFFNSPRKHSTKISSSHILKAVLFESEVWDPLKEFLYGFHRLMDGTSIPCFEFFFCDYLKASQETSHYTSSCSYTFRRYLRGHSRTKPESQVTYTYFANERVHSVPTEKYFNFLIWGNAGSYRFQHFITNCFCPNERMTRT